jgi:hypothetical protein
MTGGQLLPAGQKETADPGRAAVQSLWGTKDLLRLLNRQADDWFPTLRKNSRLSAGRCSEGWPGSKEGQPKPPLPRQRARDAQSADEGE